MQSWDEIRRWRREQRTNLIERRQAVPQNDRRRLTPLILEFVERHFPDLASTLVGFYWPFRGEVGIHPLVRRLVDRGVHAALPVVVEKRQPLEFWAWHPRMRLRRSVWNIPIPAERQVMQPTALLVPLVGFDAGGYRLGYGGGYYDRTLAAMDPKPLTIGVGLELGRLESIHPQLHDIPMDAIVTEAGVVRFGPDCREHDTLPRVDLFANIDTEPNSRRTYASPPCFMHELDSSYLGLSSKRNDRLADESPAASDGSDKTDAT